MKNRITPFRTGVVLMAVGLLLAIGSSLASGLAYPWPDDTELGSGEGRRLAGGATYLVWTDQSLRDDCTATDASTGEPVDLQEGPRLVREMGGSAGDWEATHRVEADDDVVLTCRVPSKGVVHVDEEPWLPGPLATVPPVVLLGLGAALIGLAMSAVGFLRRHPLEHERGRPPHRGTGLGDG